MSQITGARAVSSGSARSTQAALRVMEEGGNAFDAGVVGTLLLSVIDNSGFCFGGEVPILVRPAGEPEPLVVCGQGPAPRRATLEHFVRWGGIPTTALPAAAVPGQLDACLLVLERWGTRTFERCISPAIEHLSESPVGWKQRLIRTLERLIDAERSGGIDGVRRSFYGGEVGAELAEWCLESGGLIGVEDLAAYRARVERPVHRSYRGWEVYKCGPWTQGPALLQALAMLERFDLRAMGHNSADFAHTVIEALKLAFADRDAYYGDPEFVQVPLERLLSDGYAEARAALIDARRASLEPRPGSPADLGLPAPPGGASNPNRAPQDTTTCTVADEKGNIYVATPSGWGLDLEPGPTGIWLGTRLQSFNIWAGHPNCIQPGKRPRITLTPTLVYRDGEPALAVCVAGGDLQDQATLNVLLAHIDFGLAPQEAVDVPRVATHHHVSSFGQGALPVGRASVEQGIAEETIGELRSRGHLIEVAPANLGMVSAIGFARGRLSPAGEWEGMAGVA